MEKPTVLTPCPAQHLSRKKDKTERLGTKPKVKLSVGSKCNCNKQCRHVAPYYRILFIPLKRMTNIYLAYMVSYEVKEKHGFSHCARLTPAIKAPTATPSSSQESRASPHVTGTGEDKWYHLKLPPFLLVTPNLYTEHDATWSRASPGSAEVTCPGHVPSQPLPSMAGKALAPCKLSESRNISVLPALSSAQTQTQPTPATGKKMSPTPAKTSTGRSNFWSYSPCNGNTECDMAVFSHEIPFPSANQGTPV